MFTVSNQVENNITRTTEQTLKHGFYNQEISIIGLDGSFKIWKKYNNRLILMFTFDSLEKAVSVANGMITTL